MNQFDKENKDEKMLIAKLNDKIKMARSKNKIVNTDFLDMHSKNIAIKVLNSNKEKNYIMYKPHEKADKTMFLIYPDKLKDLIEENRFSYDNILSVIRIVLPNELRGEFVYKNYLSAILKLGVKREKIGDIFVFDDGADIVVNNEIKDYLIDNLKQLTRFKKSKIQNINIEDIREPIINTEKNVISVSALRLDAIVSELKRCSRSMATDLISEQKVLVNYEKELRNSILIKENDVIVIRGSGKYIISKILGENKKGKIRVEVEKFV